MAPYWLLFTYFAAGALFGRNNLAQKRHLPWMLVIGAILVGLAIGLRYEVGADWQTYEFLFTYAGYHDLGRTLTLGDPGYQFLNWSVRQVGGEIWLVNLAAGAIFSWGLYRFVRAQPDPWLSATVALPYLVIVVAMGYTRQAMAIGVVMAGLAAMERGASVVRFAAYVAVAALFHKTAVVVLPLVIFAGRRNNFLTILAALASSFVLYDLFLSESVEGFVRNYVDTAYSSQGAAIRVAMNLVPAVLFLVFRKRLRFDPHEARIWQYFALASLAMPVLLLVLPSSTAVDRLALYLIPLQLAVMPRVTYLFARENLGKVIVSSYCFLILFVWLNFAAHADFWVPYQFYPL